MTKRQLFLIAGLAGTVGLVAACQPLTAPYCESDEVTGESFCNGTPAVAPGAPAQTVTNHPDYDTDN